MKPEETARRLNGLLQAFIHGTLGLHSVHQGGWGTEMEENHRIALPGKVTEGIQFVIPEVAAQLEDDQESTVASERMLVLALIGNSYEFISECDIYDNTLSQIPEIQFLRHSRHAAFHGNEFTIYSVDENAEWRSREITEDLDGTPLIPEFIERGDGIKLVRDARNIVHQHTSD